MSKCLCKCYYTSTWFPAMRKHKKSSKMRSFHIGTRRSHIASTICCTCGCCLLTNSFTTQSPENVPQFKKRDLAPHFNKFSNWHVYKINKHTKLQLRQQGTHACDDDTCIHKSSVKFALSRKDIRKEVKINHVPRCTSRKLRNSN